MAFFDRFLKGSVPQDTPQTNTPDEASLLKYISNLSPADIDRLVDIARNQLYDNRASDSKSLTDYFDLIRAAFSSTSFNNLGNNPYTRNQRYEIYEEMDESIAYISSALDILSDDATQTDENGVIIHVDSESTKINSIVTEFIEEFELEDKVSKWARAIAKYGDLFIKVEGEYTEGITYINDTVYPGMIDRRDMNGKLVAFCNNQNTVYSNTDLYAPWEFVHFRHKGDIYKEESTAARQGIVQDAFDKSLVSAYGQSILRPAIKVYAQLRFVENMLLLSRLTNSIRRNIFMVNVGDVSPEKAFETIQIYANLLKKNINMDLDKSMYASSKHTVSYDEDIFIPVGDPQNDVRIESVGGEYNVKEAYDLEYLLNKLFSSIKVPKAYLNYEQDLNARSTLIQLDIRYARSVGQLQNTVVSGLRRLINIHLAYLGLDPDEIDLDITLTPVSSIDEEARVEKRLQKAQAARDTWDVLTSIKENLDNLENEEDKDKPPVTIDLQAAAESIMSKYLDMDQATIDKIFGRDSKDKEESKRIRSHRIYAGSDVHAMYPTEENRTEYERLRESIIKGVDNSDGDSEG